MNNNRNLWIIVVLLVLVGLGVYAYNHNDTSEEMSASQVPVNIDAQQTNTPQSGATTDPSNTSTNTASTSTTANVPSTVPVTVTTTTTSTTTDAKVKSFTVIGKNFSFTPNTIKVNKGDTVKITFTDKDGNHNFVINEFNVATKILNAGQSETVTFVASKSGSFQYYCSVGEHRQMGMWGTLTVK